MYKERVRLNTAPGGLPREVDVDVLLRGRGKYEESVAYQVKPSKGVQLSMPPFDKLRWNEILVAK